MSTTYVTAVYRSALPGTLKPMAALVAHLVLDDAGARRKGKEPRLLFLSVGRLAEALGSRPETVRRHLRELVRLGVLTVHEPGGGRRRFGRRLAGAATVYRFCPEALPTDAATLAESARVQPVNTLAKIANVPVDTLAVFAKVPASYPSAFRGGSICNEDLSVRENLTSPVGRADAFASHDWLSPTGVCSTEDE
jgi:DNA-binding transcriptional ArsR family regulator